MRVVVVGGGAAGWLAALMISKIKPENTVTVIESSKIGIIGAGEGSTGSLTNIIHNEMWDFGCNEQDFIKECDATIKLGIKHIGWGPDKNKHYYGPIDGTPTSNDVVDLVFQHALGCRDQDLLHIATELGYKIHHNKNSFVEPAGNHAYHFDAHKLPSSNSISPLIFVKLPVASLLVKPIVYPSPIFHEIELLILNAQSITINANITINLTLAIRIIFSFN